MILSNIKAWLLLGLIFLLGAVSGASLAIGLGPRFASRPPGMQDMKNRLLMEMTHRLKLTPEQQTKIEPILAEAGTQMQQVHREEIGRIAGIMETVKAKMAPILTAEQQTELQKMGKEMENRRDRMFPGHMHPHMQPGQPPPDEGGPGPHGPPPPPDAPALPPPGA